MPRETLPRMASALLGMASLPRPYANISHPFFPPYGRLERSSVTALPPSHNSGAWVEIPESRLGYVSPQVSVPEWVASPPPVPASMQRPSPYEWSADPPHHRSLSKRISKRIRRASKHEHFKKRRKKKVSASEVFHDKPESTMNANLVIPTPESTMNANLVIPTTVSSSLMGIPVEAVPTTVSSSIVGIPVEAVPTMGIMNPVERGPGWCSLCHRDCATAAMLEVHRIGKKHRKQLQRQNGAFKVIVPAADSETNLQPVPTRDIFEQIMLEVSNIGQESKSVMPVFNAEQAADGGAAVAALLDLLSDHGKKRPRDVAEFEEDLYNSASFSGPDMANADETGEMRDQKWTRCELCNVQCDTRAVLETHYRGKRHAARLRNSKRQI